MRYLLLFGLIAIISLICLALIRNFDEENGLTFGKGTVAAAVIYAAAAAGTAWNEQDIAKSVLLCFFFSYMVTASYCDHCTHYVYRFLYFMPFLAGIGYVLLRGISAEDVMSIGIFYLLVIFLFSRYFGRADTVAFLISVLFLGQCGATSGYLLQGMIHMLLSMLLLIVVKRKKINFRKGSMEPTAFMPYIAVMALAMITVRQIVEGSNL